MQGLEGLMGISGEKGALLKINIVSICLHVVVKEPMKDPQSSVLLDQDGTKAEFSPNSY